jgi:hypothetical protein
MSVSPRHPTGLLLNLLGHEIEIFNLATLAKLRKILVSSRNGDSGRYYLV